MSLSRLRSQLEYNSSVSDLNIGDQNMNLYNDIAVMVKTVSPTLVPSDDLLLYMLPW